MKKPFSKAASWLVRRSRNLIGESLLMEAFHRLDESRGGKHLMFRLFRKYSWYHLLNAQVQRKGGDDQGAFVTLMRCQRRTVRDSRLHVKLSEIYRDNGEIMAAHLHLKIADLLKPGYTTIRRLAFETDHGLLEDGASSLSRVLEFPRERIMGYLPMINRVSIHYPEHAATLDSLRAEQKEALRQVAGLERKPLSSAVETALANRWPALATELASRDRLALDPATLEWLERLERDFRGLEPLLDAAWENETSDSLKAFQGKRSLLLENPTVENLPVVEFFIPTSFFAKPSQEKPTYETIRRTFSAILRYLVDRDDVIVVPRFQLYWRKCVPKTANARVISYHTHTPSKNPAHLHIQESPLAGRCSFDHAGFAGFASIATNHQLIREFTAPVPVESLRQNHEDLVSRYVSSNVSKYQQPEENIPIEGNYVFVALQIPTDIVSRLAWVNGLELLDAVVARYRDTDVRVVVKRHPFCGSKSVQKHLQTLETSGSLIWTKNSVHSLIAGAQRVFTVNSGVGLEALLQGKTVIVTGACDYSYAATSAHDIEELRKILNADEVADPQKIQELLYYYVHRFTVSPDDGETIRRRIGDWIGLPS